MKRQIAFWICMSSGIIISFWAATEFRETQETHFNRIKMEKLSLQKKIRALENDIAFVKDHQKELDFLVSKGWFLPKNRLIAGEILEKLRGSLNKVHYTFEPENAKNMGEEYAFKVTKIVLEVAALLDSDVYEFIQEILKEFPGILIPLEFTLTRGEEINEKNLLALRQKDGPNFIDGKLIFEWFALKKDGHEK